MRRLPLTVADPDLQVIWGEGGHPDPEIRGGGGFKKFFPPLGPQFGLKIRGGRTPRAPLLDPLLL